jgi:hypothetical protein
LSTSVSDQIVGCLYKSFGAAVLDFLEAQLINIQMEQHRGPFTQLGSPTPKSPLMQIGNAAASVASARWLKKRIPRRRSENNILSHSYDPGPVGLGSSEDEEEEKEADYPTLRDRRYHKSKPKAKNVHVSF